VGFILTAFFVATGNHAAPISAAGVYVFSFLAGISLKIASMYSGGGGKHLAIFRIENKDRF